MIFSKISLAPGVYVTATPLGNARDITLRALDVLASADILVSEDTRVLRKLMQIHGIPIGNRPLCALHDHSRGATVEHLINAVGQGKSVALTSDAGTPLISDPGYELVCAAHAHEILVTSAPGPSAVITALSIAGVPTDHFAFMGFLPSKSAQRESVLQDVKMHPHPIAFYESAKRLLASLGQIETICGPHRRVAICRELTKKFEDVQNAPVTKLIEHFTHAPAKGEIVIILCPDHQAKLDEQTVDQALVNALLTHRVKDATVLVAGAFNLPKRDVYQRALELSRKDPT